LLPRRYRAWLRLHHSNLLFAVWTLLTVPVVAFYCWTAMSSSGPFVWRNDQTDHYNLLADGLLKGRLSMDLEPSPDMLALPNPYDPVANRRLRKHDASLYHGRYYLYFGVVPALTLFVPWKLFLNASPSPGFAVVLYVSLGYAFSCLVLMRLLRAARIRIPLWMAAIVFAAIGLGQFTPILLRRPEMYEVAIASGFWLLIAGLYFLSLRIFEDRGGPALTLLAGVCLGLSPGSRPHLILAVATLVALYAVFLVRERNANARAWCAEMLWLCTPIAACGALLAWYNYARFGNPLEFGMAYQLTARVETVGIKLSLGNVLPDLKTLLFFPPVGLRGFPFLRARMATIEEATVGLAEVMPLCLIGVLVVPFVIGRRRWMPSPASWAAGGLLAAAVPTLLFLCLTGNSNLRYQVDYSGTLWLAALYILLVLAYRPFAKAQGWVRALIVAGCLWSVAAAMLLSITGYENSLELKNPQLFRELEHWFGG
jgi:hypothetical protein